MTEGEGEVVDERIQRIADGFTAIRRANSSWRHSPGGVLEKKWIRHVRRKGPKAAMKLAPGEVYALICRLHELEEVPRFCGAAINGPVYCHLLLGHEGNHLGPHGGWYDRGPETLPALEEWPQ